MADSVTIRARKRADKERIVALIAQGHGAMEAVRMVGRTKAVYERWRREDRPWAAKITELRAVRGDAQGIRGADFIEFRKVYFGHDTPPHHFRMNEAVETQRPGSVTLILAWPQSAKSTLMVDRVNHRLGPIDPDHRIAIISEGQDLARKLLGQIKDRMTEEALFRPYISAFGPFKSPDREQAKPWNADYVTVLKAAIDAKEYSIESRGAGSTLYGGRFDWVWFDDIQSERNIEQTDKLLRYIRQTALTRPDLEQGFTTFTGSRVGPADIYSKMIDEELLDRLVTIPALDRWVDRNDHFEVRHTKAGKQVILNPDCPAVPTWDFFSMQRLAEIRQQMGEEIWSRTYMQRSFDASAQTFTEQMIEDAKDRTRTAGPEAVGTEIIAMVDPAFDSGRCAFMVAALSPTKMWILDAVVLTDVTRYEDIYGQMLAWSGHYHPTTWIVEHNNFQRGIPQDDRVLEMSKKFHFKVRTHQCVDPATEVLSERGWLTSDEVAVGDQILTLNMDTGESEWKPVKMVYRGHHKGRMARLESRAIDALVTWDHRWPVSAQYRHAERAFEFRTTETLCTSDWLPLARPHRKDSSPYADDLVELIGWAVCEGHYLRKGTSIHIGQSDTANPDKVDRIRLLLKRLGAHWREDTTRANGVRLFCVSGPIAVAVRSLTWDGSRKQLPPSLIAALSTDQCRLLLETMVDADGWRQGPRGRAFCNNDVGLVQAVEMLAALTGSSTRRSERYGRSDRKGRPVRHYTVSIRTWRNMMMGNHRTGGFTSVDYDGEVWCPNTDNGTFYARRGGVAYFTGNTNRNKNDPVLGVAMMASAFVDHEISIPWGDDETARRMGGLTDELRMWRPRVRGRDLVQDFVMTLWFGWLYWERQRHVDNLGAKSDGWNVGAMPVMPTGYKPLTLASA